MSRPTIFDSRSMTDYRQSCVRENEIQKRILSQMNGTIQDNDSYSTVSVQTSKFLQDNSAVIRDTDRNLVFNNRELL